MERQWKPGLMLRGCETECSTKQTLVSSAFLPLLYKGMQIGEICWLLWANPLHGFRLLENHSRTENKPPGQSPCLNYTQCWFIFCPEYVIECLMDSLFISELTHLNVYIIKAEHVFSIYERKSYFRVFAHRVGIFFSVWTILKNKEVSSTKGQRKTRKPPLKTNI